MKRKLLVDDDLSTASNSSTTGAEFNAHNSTQIQVCSICEAPASGCHFGAPSCSACAAFFRRTVSLNKIFNCHNQNKCRLNYEMKIICRACRFEKCQEMGMMPSGCRISKEDYLHKVILAVQPRRNCDEGRRKICYRSFEIVKPSQKKSQKIQHVDIELTSNDNSIPLNSNSCNSEANNDILAAAMDLSGLLTTRAPSLDSRNGSIVDERITPLHMSTPNDSIGAMTLESLLRNEKLFNERRRLLNYSINNRNLRRIEEFKLCDIPFSQDDLQELTAERLLKHSRSHIMLVYEWMRGWTHFDKLDSKNKMKLLRRCILYHTLIDTAYLTVKLGLDTKRYVMYDGTYGGMADDSTEGWQDEQCLSAELKRKLYRPLLKHIIDGIVLPMKDIDVSFQEFVILKSLLTFRGGMMSIDFTEDIRNFMTSYTNCLLRALHYHYAQNDLSSDVIAERTGNLILLMSSIFEVAMECLECHLKIKLFDLYKLDELVLKLIHPRLAK